MTPALGMRLDELTPQQARTLPEGTCAEERCGVYVAEYYMGKGGWRQAGARDSWPCGVPWLARITSIPRQGTAR